MHTVSSLGPHRHYDNLTDEKHKSLLCGLVTDFLPCRSVQPALVDPALAQHSGMQAEGRQVTLSDGEVLTVSGSSTTFSTVQLKIH